MLHNTQRRVVISGLGVVAPNGTGQEAFWDATLHGRSGITQLDTTTIAPTHPIHVAGSINNFIVEEHIGRKLIQRTDRMTHFALAAIQEALTDAHLLLEEEDPQRVGAVIANTQGGVDFVLKQMHTLYTRGPRFVSAYTAIAWLSVANVGQAAIRYGFKGYCKTPVNDTVSGLDAMTMAYTAIRRGAADVLLTGGCEAFLHPFILLVLAKQGQCYVGHDIDAYRPFDTRAAGLIMAEGASMCVLEEYEHAQRRGAPIYGEIVGYGQTNDAHGLHAPSADGTYYAQALCQALHQGESETEDIAYISLDGRAMSGSDQGEVDALHQAFGTQLAQLPVSVPRTILGHSYAAAGAFDTITALLALKHGLIPPTINCEQLDPRYGLDMVRDEPRPIHSDKHTVLIGGRGLGGANVALTITNKY